MQFVRYVHDYVYFVVYFNAVVGILISVPSGYCHGSLPEVSFKMTSRFSFKKISYAQPTLLHLLGMILSFRLSTYFNSRTVRPSLMKICVDVTSLEVPPSRHLISYDANTNMGAQVLVVWERY